MEKIAEVVEIPEENLLPSPSIGHNEKKKTKERYVYAIGKVGDSVKLLLDPDKLISDEDLSLMEQASEEAQELEDTEE